MLLVHERVAALSFTSAYFLNYTRYTLLSTSVANRDSLCEQFYYPTIRRPRKVLSKGTFDEWGLRANCEDYDFLLNFSRVLGGLGRVLVSDDRYANDSVSLSEEWASC